MELPSEFAPVSGYEPVPPKIESEDALEALPEGSQFIAPDGSLRKKPYKPKTPEDMAAVPEGEDFLDPTGELRQRPKYEGINFTAQTLHDMALTPEGKRQALELHYPGKVKQEGLTDELYVEDDNGVRRKPNRGFVTPALSHLAAEAAPAAGMIGGMMAGGGAGTVAAPGPGTAAGAFGGMVLGTMAGQAFNNIILRLAGIDETHGSEIGAIGGAGAAAAGGEVLGRGIASIPAGVAKAKGVINRGAEIVGDFLGVNESTLPTALRIAEHGEKPAEGWFSGIRNKLGLTETDTPVRPSAVFMEAPKLHLNTEVFDPAFRTQKPLKQGETKYYEDKAGELFDDLGIPRPQSFTSPTAATSTQKAGEALQNKAILQSAESDAKIKAVLEQRKADLAAGVQPQVSQRDAILAANQKSLDDAENLVTGAVKSVEANAEAAMNALKTNSNSGDLWWLVAEKLKAARDAVGTAYRRYAGNAYDVAGDTPLSTSSLATTAKDFLEQVPEEFQKRMPQAVRDIAKLAEGDESGTATFEQLHNIRKMFSAAADWYDLPSDLKNGMFKYFSHQIDNVLQSRGAPENIQLAARMLNATDEWYGKQIGIFNASEIKSVMDGLRHGEPADPEALFKTLVKPFNSDKIARVHEVVGDNIWSGVKAAQTKNWLTKAGTSDPARPDVVKFADQVVDAFHDGTLHAVQGKEKGDELFRLAQMIHTLNGKVDVNINPKDTAFDIMRKAVAAGKESIELAKQDPLGTLTKEIQKMERQAKVEAKQARRDDILAFLADKTTGANAAMEKILGSEDLIIAVEARFGRDSPEFKALQKVWVEKIFTGSRRAGESLKDVSPEVQKIMLGTSLETAKKLIEEITLMRGARDLGRQTAQGMAAVSQIQNPMGTLASSKGALQATAKSVAKVFPMSDPIARSVLTQYYALATKLTTSPGLLRWLEKGLSGGIKDKEAARQVVQSILTRGGRAGAALGEGGYQGWQMNQPQEPIEQRQ